MSDTLWYLVRHGYVVLFASVLAHRLGVPLPSTPFIVTAGGWLERAYPVVSSAR